MSRPPIDPHIVYSPRYEADIGPHVFPTEKYRGVYESLCRTEGLRDAREPHRPGREVLERVHTSEYLDDLLAFRVTSRTIPSELPISPEIVEWSIVSCGGTIAACQVALEHRWAAHIGGGFHHAFADHAEGFCYLNDLAVACGEMLAADSVERIAVIDVDVHQGNGTAAIFAGDDRVFTFSIHQEDNYPIKQRSDLDIGLVSFDPSRPDPAVTDDVYLTRLRAGLKEVMDRGRPELVLYVAGADPFREDQLGGFRLTRGGLAARDELVFSACLENDIAVAITLAGGYAVDVADTIAIHETTIRTAHRMWSEV